MDMVGLGFDMDGQLRASRNHGVDTMSQGSDDVSLGLSDNPFRDRTESREHFREMSRRAGRRLFDLRMLFQGDDE